MATYYRWRKSTVKYTDIEQTANEFTLGPFKGSSYHHMVSRSNGNTYSTDGIYYILNNEYNTEVYESGSVFLTDSTYFQYVVTPPVASQSNILYKASAGGGRIYNDNGNIIYFAGQGHEGTKYTRVASAGTFQGYVYSTSSSAYPNGGVSGSYYYDQRTTVESPTAPTNLTVPNPITSTSFTVSWQAATSNIPDYPVQSYEVLINSDASPMLAIQTVNETSADITIPTSVNGIPVTGIIVYVRAKDTNGQWGLYGNSGTTRIPVYFSPTLMIPSQFMQGQQATISWSEVDGADSYTLQRKANTNTDWTQVYSGANLTFSETVGTWTTVQYRVQAVFDGTAGGWAESATIPVVSASSLVISGTDEDLGVVTNDIPYSISTDTGNQITATITVNNAVIFSGSVGNSTADVIPVLDLITGEGTIVISATVDASGSPVTATRTWTYEKAAITFPNSGSVAQITKEGENIYPKVLAEGVRLPGGKTLDQVMGFPAQIYMGSYVGTGTSGASNPNTLTFPFEPKVVYIYGQGAGINLIGSWGWTRGVQEGIVLVQNELMKPGITISWADKSVSWYQSGTAEEAAYQMNSPGVTYLYVALG